MSCQDISAGLFSAGEHALTFRESFNAKFYDKAEKIPRMIVNVIVTQHHRRPSAQTGRIKGPIVNYVPGGGGGIGGGGTILKQAPLWGVHFSLVKNMRGVKFYDTATAV